MKRRSLVVVIFSTTATSGCNLLSLLYGETGSAPPVVEPVATTGAMASWKISVGTGESSFVELADNDPVQKYAGPQGGYHVWVSLRVDGITTDALQLETEVDAAGTGVSRATSFAELESDPPPSTWKTIHGQRAFVSLSTSGPAVLRVKLIDPKTHAWASAERPVFVR